MNPEELDALASAVAEKTGQFRKPPVPRDPKRVLAWWSVVTVVLGSIFGGVLTVAEQIQSTLWGESLQADLQYVRQHIDREGPEFVDSVDSVQTALTVLLPSLDSLTREIHENEHADRRYRMEAAYVNCQQRERQAMRDGTPWARDCVREYRDSLDVLRDAG